jgi:hypothetical protein
VSGLVSGCENIERRSESIQVFAARRLLNS